MSEQEKASVTTSCRECVFATWEENTQTGCQFDRIDKLEDNGAEILGQDDGQKKYFLIVGRFCNACRNKEWGKLNPKRKWKKLVEDRIKIQMDIIINVRDNTLEEVLETVNSAYKQEIKAKTIIVACDPDYNQIPVIDIVSEMRNFKGTWRVENLKPDKVAKFCRNTYYAVFNAGYYIPPDFISRINKAINEDMTRFVAIRPDENGNGLVMQRAGVSLEDFTEMAEKTNTGHMIKNHEDL